LKRVVVNAEENGEQEVDDEGFVSLSDEEVIHIYSEAETIECGSEEEEERADRSYSLNEIGSDEITLVGSSQCSEKLSPSKSSMKDVRILLTEEEYEGYEDYIRS
jgi:hypothetical protein